MAITWEPDFSQACSIRRVLMHHNNFHFISFSDKTSYKIFPIEIFLKKSRSVTHNPIWAPNTMPSFRKNLWANSEKSSGSDRRTGKHYFVGPFQPWLGVQLNNKSSCNTLSNTFDMSKNVPLVSKDWLESKLRKMSYIYASSW